MPTIETALTRTLGITHPILLAPMGSAAGGNLAAALNKDGGLGQICTGYTAAARPRPSAMPPAATTGIEPAMSTTAGTKPIVPRVVPE